MTPEEREDVRQAVAYHQLHGGFAEHNASGRGCRCAGCRLVRVVMDLDEAQEAVEVFWAEADAVSVRILTKERPEVIDLAQRLHAETHHGDMR